MTWDILAIVFALAAVGVVYLMFRQAYELYHLNKNNSVSFTKTATTRYRHVLLIKNGSATSSSYVFMTDNPIKRLDDLLMEGYSIADTKCDVLVPFMPVQDGSNLLARPCDIILADINTPVVTDG